MPRTRKLMARPPPTSGRVLMLCDSGTAHAPVASRARGRTPYTDEKKHLRPVGGVRVAGVRLRTPVSRPTRRGPKTDPSHPGLPPKAQVSFPIRITHGSLKELPLATSTI